MNRIAPNNQLPATHFIEVWKAPEDSVVRYFFLTANTFADMPTCNTIAIFRIRENKLPTKHKF